MSPTPAGLTDVVWSAGESTRKAIGVGVVDSLMKMLAWCSTAMKKANFHV